MSLPDYHAWEATRSALHQAMQVLRSARLLSVSPQPNDAHYGMFPIPAGAATGPLNSGGTLSLDFARGMLIYERGGVETFTLGLRGRSQRSLFVEAFAGLRAAGLSGEPDRSKITHDEPLDFDPEQGAEFGGVMWRMALALMRFKARMSGAQSPLMLWAHGFDYSSLWFPGGMDERRDPHINVGFSPGTPDVGQPYFYLYAWPPPQGLREALPPGMIWMEGWSAPGGALPYALIARSEDPEGLAIDMLWDFFGAAAGALKAR